MGTRCVFVRGLGCILFAIATLSQAAADPLPTRVGECSQTTIGRIGARLEDVAGSGSALQFANAGYQASDETGPEITRSQAGDKVRVCLVTIRQSCPPGDNRGRIYRTTNLRTRETLRLPDSPHSRGGA